MKVKGKIKRMTALMLAAAFATSGASAWNGTEITVSQSGYVVLESGEMSGSYSGDTATNYVIDYNHTNGSGSNNSAVVLSPSRQAYWNAYYDIYQKRNALVGEFSDIYDSMTEDNQDGVGDFNGRTYTIYNWLESLDDETKEKLLKLYRDYIGSLGQQYIDENDYLSQILEQINEHFNDGFTVSGEALDDSGNEQSGQRYGAASYIDSTNPYASSTIERITISSLGGGLDTNRQIFDYLLRIYYDMIARGIIPGTGASQLVVTPHDAKYNFDGDTYNLFSMIQQLLAYIQTNGGDEGSSAIMRFFYEILGLSPDDDHTGVHSMILSIYDRFRPDDTFGIGEPGITGMRPDIYPTDDEGNGMSDYDCYSKRYAW